MGYSSHITSRPETKPIRQFINGFIAEDVRLEAAIKPGHLRKLGQELGVKNILTRPMPDRKDSHPGIDAMLIPLPTGYSVVIDEKAPESRQRYSLAHELAHVMLLESDPSADLPPKEPRYRSSAAQEKQWKAEERLCDEIAAELIMPEKTFAREVATLGYSLGHLPQLANLFKTSLTATAIRYWELLTEPCHLLKWRPTPHDPNRIVPAWQMRNKVSGISICPITGSSIAKRGEFSAIRDNWREVRTLFSYECLLAKYKTAGAPHVRPLLFESEHVGFGGPANRSIISVVYLNPDLYN